MFYVLIQSVNNNNQSTNNDKYQQLNISDIQRSIERYNEYQTIINEEIFGPLLNDSIIIVIQVSIVYQIVPINFTRIL